MITSTLKAVAKFSKIVGYIRDNKNVELQAVVDEYDLDTAGLTILFLVSTGKATITPNRDAGSKAIISWIG